MDRYGRPLRPFGHHPGLAPPTRPYARPPASFPPIAPYSAYDAFGSGYGPPPPRGPPGFTPSFDRGRGSRARGGGFGGRGGGGFGGQRGGSRGRGALRGRGGARGRGKFNSNVPRDPITGRKLNKQEIRQKAIEDKRKQTGFFFFYEKKLRCCTKIITKDCPHILQPQPMDFLMVYDDPSYVDESINAPYMKEVEKRQQIKRKRVEKKFATGVDISEEQEKKEVDLEMEKLVADEQMEEAKEDDDDDEEEEEKEEEETPTQTLTLGSCLANLLGESGKPQEESKEEDKEEKDPWVWPQPFKPKPPTKRQRKQIREVPQGLNCMFSVTDLKRRKYNHSWVQVHKQKPWIAIPCIKRLVQRRDEMKEEFQDLEKHLKWHPEDSAAIKKKGEIEKIFKRLRNRVHSFLKRLELQYLTTGYEGVQDLIAQFLEERQDDDGIEVIFKKEHDDAAAERLAAEKEAKRLEEGKRPREEASGENAAQVTDENSASKKPKTDGAE